MMRMMKWMRTRKRMMMMTKMKRMQCSKEQMMPEGLALKDSKEVVHSMMRVHQYILCTMSVMRKM